ERASPTSAHARPAVLPATMAVTMVAHRNAESGGAAGSMAPTARRATRATPAQAAANENAFAVRGSIVTAGNCSNTRVPAWGICASLVRLRYSHGNKREARYV